MSDNVAQRNYITWVKENGRRHKNYDKDTGSKATNGSMFAFIICHLEVSFWRELLEQVPMLLGPHEPDLGAQAHRQPTWANAYHFMLCWAVEFVRFQSTAMTRWIHEVTSQWFTSENLGGDCPEVVWLDEFRSWHWEVLVLESNNENLNRRKQQKRQDFVNCPV